MRGPREPLSQRPVVGRNEALQKRWKGRKGQLDGLVSPHRDRGHCATKA